MIEELQEIANEDPTILKVFVAEYYFLKNDMEKAYTLLTQLYANPKLSPVMKNTVKNYLVVASKVLRQRELDSMTFSITFTYTTKDGQNHLYIIDKQSIVNHVQSVGVLLEFIDYYLKKQQGKEGLMNNATHHP